MVLHPFHDPDYHLWILTNASSEQVIEWLRWNDPNGIWTDADSAAEDKPPLTLEQARRWMRRALCDGQSLTKLPDDANSATCRAWLRLTCWQFGLGFHLDTPATEHVFENETRLPAGVSSQLDSWIAHIFAVLGEEEPYAVCTDEFAAIIALTSAGAEARDHCRIQTVVGGLWGRATLRS